MIAKLAVWGRSRVEAIDRLRRALDEYEVAGIITTIPFFRAIVKDQEFIAGHLDTGFIVRFNERRRGAISAPPPVVESDMALIAAAIHHVRMARKSSLQTAGGVSNRWKMSARETQLNGSQRATERSGKLSQWEKE
jgi:acetyl/propionyl-CoA carboxylase alpha subunit